jgi:hypothetical protein
MAFYQSRDVAVLGAAQQIPFPMAGNGSVFRLRGSFPDRDSIDDLTPRLSAITGLSRAAHAPLRPQVLLQLFFQYSPRLNEQAAVNGLVGHAQALVIGILSLQPPGNLLRRPIQHQFTRNDVPQSAVHGKKTPFRAQGRAPGLLIRFMSAIARTATMAGDLSAHRRGSSTQVSGDLPHRRAGSNPSRDVLSLRKGEG